MFTILKQPTTNAQLCLMDMANKYCDTVPRNKGACVSSLLL